MVWVAERGELVGLQTLPGAHCHSPALSVVLWGGMQGSLGGEAPGKARCWGQQATPKTEPMGALMTLALSHKPDCQLPE